MICEVCKDAADNPLLRQGHGYVVRSHNRCTGCDCQHKPPGTGIKKEIKNAQRPD